jgi:hypothetical protein
MKKVLILMLPVIALSGSTAFAASFTQVQVSPGFHYSSKSTSTTTTTPEGIKKKSSKSKRKVNGVTVRESGPIKVVGSTVFVNGRKIDMKTGKFAK